MENNNKVELGNYFSDLADRRVITMDEWSIILWIAGEIQSVLSEVIEKGLSMQNHFDKNKDLLIEFDTKEITAISRRMNKQKISKIIDTLMSKELLLEDGEKRILIKEKTEKSHDPKISLTIDNAFIGFLCGSVIAEWMFLKGLCPVYFNGKKVFMK